MGGIVVVVVLSYLQAGVLIQGALMTLGCLEEARNGVAKDAAQRYEYVFS